MITTLVFPLVGGSIAPVNVHPDDAWLGDVKRGSANMATPTNAVALAQLPNTNRVIFPPLNVFWKFSRFDDSVKISSLLLYTSPKVYDPKLDRLDSCKLKPLESMDIS